MCMLLLSYLRRANMKFAMVFSHLRYLEGDMQMIDSAFCEHKMQKLKNGFQYVHKWRKMANSYILY